MVVALSRKSFRRIDRVTFAAVGLMAFQIVPILVTWPLSDRLPAARAPVITGFWIVNFPLALVFSHTLLYLLLLVAASGLLLLAVSGAQQRRLCIALVTGFGVVLFYALAPWYQYPLVGAQSYQLEAVTGPGWNLLCARSCFATPASFRRTGAIQRSSAITSIGCRM